MSAEVLRPVRELDHRTSDGIVVRMLWCERDNRVMVAVDDRRNDEGFCIEVRDGERALDVFHHPYAYAAQRSVVATSARATAEEWIVRAA